MKKYLVDLTEDERATLHALVRRGKTSARKVTRARILLHAARGATDAEVVSALGVGVATVERIRRRFVEEGLGALDERPRPGARPRLSEKAEARLVAEACSQAPEGADTGRCGCWPGASSNWGWPTPARTRRCAGR